MDKKRMTFNVLVKKEGKEFVAHCLELDIVTVACTLTEAKSDIKNLIMAQVDYAFSNNNLENLYRPAPPEVWRDFYNCRNAQEKKIRMRSEKRKNFVPPWIIANTCTMMEAAAAVG